MIELLIRPLAGIVLFHAGLLCLAKAVTVKPEAGGIVLAICVALAFALMGLMGRALAEMERSQYEQLHANREPEHGRWVVVQRYQYRLQPQSGQAQPTHGGAVVAAGDSVGSHWIDDFDDGQVMR